MPVSDVVETTITSSGQIVITLDPVLVPFHYTEVEIEGFLLETDDLTITVKASEPGPARAHGTRALVLSERQIAIVQSTLRRRAARDSSYGPVDGLQETLDAIEDQRSST